MKKEALSVVIDGGSIAEICSLPINDVLNWTQNLASEGGPLTPREKTIGSLLLYEIKTRVNFLISV